MICDRPDRGPKLYNIIVYGPPSTTRRHWIAGVYLCEIQQLLSNVFSSDMIKQE